MAIAKNPKRSLTANNDKGAEAFISAAAQQTSDERERNKKSIMVRIAPDILKRIDRAANRLGISRSAFIVSSAAERLERME